jgi:hypothetical protein
MPFPFSLQKDYTSSRTSEELMAVLTRVQPNRKWLQFYPVDNYSAEIRGTGFLLRPADPARNLPAMPRIKVDITHAHPTIVHVTITPNYFLIAFLLVFPIVFIPAALFSDDWTINGVHRAPELTERLMLVLGAGGMPMLLCYVAAIVPIKKAKAWLVDKLALQ